MHLLPSLWKVMETTGNISLRLSETKQPRSSVRAFSRKMYHQACNQPGPLWWAKSSLRGPTFFKLCSTHFSRGGGEKGFAPGYGLCLTTIETNSKAWRKDGTATNFHVTLVVFIKNRSKSRRKFTGFPYANDSHNCKECQISQITFYQPGLSIKRIGKCLSVIKTALFSASNLGLNDIVIVELVETSKNIHDVE